MKKFTSIGIIGGMGPQAGLFAHELLLRQARQVWPTYSSAFPYDSSSNYTS